MNKKPLAVLSKRDLDAATFASTDNSRPVICHVLVRRRGSNVQLIATDSYALVVADIPAIEYPEFDEFVVPADVMLLAKKVISKVEVDYGRRTKKVDDKVELYADRLVIQSSGVTLPIKTEQDATNYPKIDKLIKDIDRQKADDVTLNAKLLERATKYVGSDPAGSGSNACKIVINGKLAPVEITNGNTYALVMPLKG